jgi:hypothetical protein
MRINSITGFHGGAEELVNCSRRGGLKDNPRSFTQCVGCATSKAACMTILVQDAAVISHGPVGCSSCYHEFAFTYRRIALAKRIGEVMNGQNISAETDPYQFSPARFEVAKSRPSIS